VALAVLLLMMLLLLLPQRLVPVLVHRTLYLADFPAALSAAAEEERRNKRSADRWVPRAAGEGAPVLRSLWNRARLKTKRQP
jgi:hypothetical protein